MTRFLSRALAACPAVLLAIAPLSGRSPLDLDGDGLSEVWQIAFGAENLEASGDADGDGRSNLEECEHGTDPFDASSRFDTYRFEHDPAGVAFAFEAAPGQSYVIEVSSDLVNWEPGSKRLLSQGGPERLVGEGGENGVRFMRFRIGNDEDADGISDFEENLLTGYDPFDQHTDSAFMGGDMARLMRDWLGENGVTVAGETIPGTSPSLEEASRFLTQAALGSRLQDIERVAELGYDGWLEEQFAQDAGYVSPVLQWWFDNNEDVFEIHRHYSWWQQVMTSPDLLRQRMAVALGEIYVISDTVLGGGAATTGMADYYDLLLDHSFGNWRDLLSEVSLHPTMGTYLSHLKNRKADPVENRYPDENYAREIMQLFSIGLFELNADGTRRKDAQGRDIPTYDNDTITNLARVFTGFAFGGPDNDTSVSWHFQFGDWVWDEPMKVWEHEHDQDAKALLNGVVLPAFADDPGRTAMDDFEETMDNLFEHPNVGPFVAYRLIQRLVTSNPTPGYVERVAGVFANNGQGVRGDMRSVVKAILLDAEARSPAAYEIETAGRLREPYLRWVRLVKSLEARSEDGSFLIPDWGHMQNMGQRVMASNSVFNFFSPDYVPVGEMAEAGLVGPEFQILTATTAMATQNTWGGALMWSFGIYSEENPETQMNFDLPVMVEYLDQGDLDGAISHLDLILCHGTLAEGTKDILRAAYEDRAGWFDTRQSAAMLVRIVMLSPEFSVTM